MGSAVISICGNTDFFRDLLEKYGQAFVKLILSQKAKMQLQEKFAQIMAKIKEYVQIFVKKVDEMVDGKIKQLTQSFQQLKQNVNDILPGGIASLQQQKGMSINEISGFNSFVQQIDSIRDKTLQQVHQQRIQAEKDLLQKKNHLYKQIEQQRPKVPLYQNLSDQTRFRVLRRAEKQFSQQIEQSKKKMDDRCDRSFNQDVSKMDSFFDRINPQNFLDDFVQKSVGQMFKKLASKGGCGKFSCLFDMC